MLLAVLGDSLTQGFPFGEKISWLEVVKEQMQINVQNHGVCGETTADMRMRLNGILMQEELTHLLIFGGANDIILDRRPAEYILADILAMQEVALQKRINVGCVLPLIPAIGNFEKDFIKVRELIKEKSLCEIFVTDFQFAFKKEENNINYLSDGVHLTIKGNKNLGDYAAQALKTWLT